MEISKWALRILSADTLEEKLLDPGTLTDDAPGHPIFWKEPTRPTGMGFHKHTRKDRLPSVYDLGSIDKRASCLHRFAGHELLAVEIMAYALLAFPDAPKTFRRGVAHTLKEEQGHVRLYMARMEEMHLHFGDLPLYKHFWSYVPFLTSPLRYISLMSLTFEMANLDFAPMYGAAFARQGDDLSSKLMQKILEDEISHVSFGCRWLQKWKEPGASDWKTWISAIPPKVPPSRAKGVLFSEENRRLAGVSDEWIKELKASRA